MLTFTVLPPNIKFSYSLLLFNSWNVDKTRQRFRPANLHNEVVPFFHGKFSLNYRYAVVTWSYLTIRIFVCLKNLLKQYLVLFTKKIYKIGVSHNAVGCCRIHSHRHAGARGRWKGTNRVDHPRPQAN